MRLCGYAVLRLCCLAVVGLCCAVQEISGQVVNFSDQAMFHSDAFSLSLTPSSSDCKVYYTTDGSIPTRDCWRLYTQPLQISTTTPVSAVCVDERDSICAVCVRTYIFLSDVYHQSASPEGYPAIWSKKDTKNYWPADYGMDTKITESDEYKPLLDSAMHAIPTVCLTTNIDYLFSQSEDEATGGIYVHTGKDLTGLGDGWERPASIEYFDADGSGYIQQNCGLLLHGGNSRNPQNSPKHSFRVSFRKQYGAGKLKHRIFDDEDAVKKFDHLVLRAGYNYTWIKNGSQSLYPQNIIQRTNAQYILDSWAKEAHHEMGNTITHRRFVHLYINGLYWGLYEICEKVNDNFASAYYGGEDEEYDVVDTDGKKAVVMDGNLDAYNDMAKTAKAVTNKDDDANYRKLIDEQLLDMENYVDYMLVNWYIGNDDWDHNNWRCFRNRENVNGGFRYLVWDAETSFTDVAYNKVKAVKGDPTLMMAALKKNPVFKEIAQERILKHLTGDGILTPAKAAALYERLCSEIDLPIICESARWGDYRVLTGETKVTYTRNEHWLKRKNDLLQNYFPQRTAYLLSQLEEFGLYDSTGITSPDFTYGSWTNKNTRANMYNLQGMQVGSGYKGFVIVNGRKYVNR